jgi:hypothetical protein
MAETAVWGTMISLQKNVLPSQWPLPCLFDFFFPIAISVKKFGRVYFVWWISFHYDYFFVVLLTSVLCGSFDDFFFIQDFSFLVFFLYILLLFRSVVIYLAGCLRHHIILVNFRSDLHLAHAYSYESMDVFLFAFSWVCACIKCFSHFFSFLIKR